MAAWGHGFYLLVLKVSLTRERCFRHSKIKFVSPRGHVISSIYENQLNAIVGDANGQQSPVCFTLVFTYLSKIRLNLKTNY